MSGYQAQYESERWTDPEADEANGEQLKPMPFFAAAPVATCGERLDSFLGYSDVAANAITTSCFVSTPVLLATRVFMFAYITFMVALMYVKPATVPVGPAWFVNGSIATMALTSLYFGMTIFLSIRYLCQGSDAEGRRAVVADGIEWRITWSLFQVVFTWSLAGLVYFLFDRGTLLANLAPKETYWAIHLHLLSFGLACADLVLSRMKFHFGHYIFYAVAALTYVAANIVYLHADAELVDAWKWNSFFSALLIFGVLFGVLVSFVLAVLLTTARDMCHINNRAEVVMPDDK
jgi:hypothetical protein